MPIVYRALWTAGVTGTGYTVVTGRDTTLGNYQEAADELASRLHTFFDTLKVVLPAGVIVQFDQEAVVLNTTTGVLEEVLSVTPPAQVVGNASAPEYSAVSGGRVDWLTEAIVGTRRLRGRTFIVPTAWNTYDAVGTLTSSAVTALATAASAYLDDGAGPAEVKPSVWSRAHGIQADITSAFVPDKVSMLTSRRD